MSKTHKFQKLGGWLLFFVICLFLQASGVLAQFSEGGMLDIVRGWSMYDGAQGWLLMAGQALSLLLNIVHVFVAIEILRRDPYFLRTRQQALVISALDIPLRAVNGVAYGFADYELAMLVVQGVFFLLGAIFAMLYYTRSVRVRTYMGTDEYLRLGFLTKKMKGPKPAVRDKG